MLTLEQFKKINEDQQYKHIGLFNKNGDPLVRFNSTNKGPKERLEMIEKRLSSPSLTDEYYVIKGKNNTQGDTISDEYIIENEKITMSENNNAPQTLNGHVSPVGNKVYNFKEGIELNSKLIRLEIENKYLETRIKELENTIKDLEDQLEETTLLDENKENPIQDFLTETIKTAAPLLDKYFELKERKIQLSENNYLAQAPAPAPENNFRNLNKEGADLLDEKIKMFILQQAPEDQDTLKQMYNSSSTLDGFFTQLQQMDPELLEYCKSFMNNGN